jgi:CHAT domain-containing protein
LEKKRLLIVSDGALQYIPFAALPKPDSRPKTQDPKPQTTDHEPPTTDHRPLIVDHEVVHLPSASVLAVLRRELVARQAAARTVAVLADPVFQENDPRVKRPPSQAEPKSDGAAAKGVEPPLVAESVTRSARESGLASFARLPLSRREAEAITSLTPKTERLTALDFRASKPTVAQADLRQYRIVHFATHGLLNSQHPELSGIVLSLVDEQGKSQDGFLRLHEIYNLELGADLVVLSACQTALGKEIKGEGLVGLTRGFMYAGAPRVVASLWKVDDKATAELMKQFYRGMLKEGLRPAAALRAAQVSMWQEQRWHAPYYWAGFVLQGEWK